MKDTSTGEDYLIWQLKRDSRWAFDRLYHMYARCLFAFAREYCHQRETVEEIVEDTFVWLWNHRHDIRQEETLLNLVFIRARHLLINAYRATLNSPRFEDYVDYANRLGTAGQSTLMEYDDFLRVLRQGLDRLPPTQRRVIELARLEQKSIKEIATLLDFKEQTVRNQLSLGLKQLMVFVRRLGYGMLPALLLIF